VADQIEAILPLCVRKRIILRRRWVSPTFITYPSHPPFRNIVPPSVTFGNLPTTPIFTLGLDTPPSWIVSPKTSPYDLDNLLLSSVHSPVSILFTLKQLLIEGHAREGHNVPPRGLHLQLTAHGLSVTSDTQVMANLGYFQFKAVPGVYDLSIRPGRGREVYEIESVGGEGWDSRAVEATGTGVVLKDFGGVTILPRFRRKEGMEAANVLADEKVVEDTTLVQSVWSR
jgi:UDP-glucose:glycoprotein glucosyltransferase